MTPFNHSGSLLLYFRCTQETPHKSTLFLMCTFPLYLMHCNFFVHYQMLNLKDNPWFRGRSGKHSLDPIAYAWFHIILKSVIIWSNYIALFLFCLKWFVSVYQPTWHKYQNAIWLWDYEWHPKPKKRGKRKLLCFFIIIVFFPSRSLSSSSGW